VHQVELSYSFGVSRASAAIRNPLMDLLQAIRAHGSISAAAKGMGLSYRHVWGELKKWEQTLGHTLVVWEKGHPARLSEFGDKLLWAERQAQARLAPQIDALQAELERTFAVAFDDAAHVVSFTASHDDALNRLRDHAVATNKLHLDIRFTGSVDAIGALNEGRCEMAGFHTTLAPATGSLSERTYKPLLQPGQHKLIGFARRTQGLMVARGNPGNLLTLQDLTRPGVRFVNRPKGTGTRLLLDELLADEGIAAGDIVGYEQTEPSHSAVAHAVASGAADAALGIELAAHAHGLDFVPLRQENYFLVCLKSTLDLPATQALLAVLRSETWQQQLARMPGYEPSHTGEVLAMNRVLSWWDFPNKKAPRPQALSGEG
jgi:putative molybdopterin biosynthesis protein